MENRTLIIRLIKEEMKHEQLIQGIQKLGFQSDLHGLDISGVVAELMGIREADMSWEWFDIYMEFLARVDQYKIIGNGENLLVLAEACYASLYAQMQIEQQKTKA